MSMRAATPRVSMHVCKRKSISHAATDRLGELGHKLLEAYNSDSEVDGHTAVQKMRAEIEPPPRDDSHAKDQHEDVIPVTPAATGELA